MSFLVQAVVPAGYYHFAKNKSKNELKTALKNVSSPMRELEYGSGPGYTWEGFFYTDRRSDSTVVDMYSSIVRKQNSFMAVDGMHIEHSLPKSWWGAHENMAYKDLFHLYPADALTNSTKNNLPLGEVTGTPILSNGVTKIGKNGFGTYYVDNCFEPADEFKGDFARSYFYISTIYEDLAPLWQSPMMNNNSYPVWKPWAIDLLLKWHRQDPVSPKELTRNERIYSIQSNRNPFIDFPSLAEYIWGADTTKIFPFPVETEAYLTSPKRGTTIDFGTIMTNDQRSIPLDLKGVSIVGNISVVVKNNSSSLQLTASQVSVQNATNGYVVNVVFQPIVSGAIRDTIIISGGGLSENMLIPVKANASPDFVLLEPTNINPQGGKLHWISDPDATDYLLKVYQPEQKAGDLIISAYVEGSSWNKAVEIFNGTGKTVDLSKYALRKQSNGDGAFGTVLKLNGLLENNKTYTVVHKSATNQILTSKANLLTDSLLQINGNDALTLTRNGMMIDMVGEANAGANVIWGLDLTLQRKKSVTHPVSTFAKTDWNVLPYDSVAFIGTHTLAFPAMPIVYYKNGLVGKTTEFEINNLQPNSIYTYSVEAIKQTGNTEALNTMQLRTSNLTAPIIMKADDVTLNSFKVNWEEELFADNYLLDVFTTSGQADKTESEGFDNVGTSGTPLPVGWSGTATGNYPTATSSGIAIPSISLKNNGEYLVTKLYDSSVSKLTFMYRFASTATGSSLLFEGFQNGQWTQLANYLYVNTTKVFPIFNFLASQNYRQFRFTYNKSIGNLAIDDVQATYGKQDTVFILKKFAVNKNYFTVSGLQPNTNYKFRVQSSRGNATSVSSDVMEQQTLIADGVKNVADQMLVCKVANGLKIKNLCVSSVITLFDITGNCIFSKSVFEPTEVFIPIAKQGVFVVKIQTKNRFYTCKIMN